jgi:hypothetical protein
MKGETCLPEGVLDIYQCERSDKNCCQAICSNGTRCQNAAKYKLNLSEIPLLGGSVSKYACQTMKLVPLRDNEGIKLKRRK